MTERLLLVGVSQRSAPIALRDRLAPALDDLAASRAELVGAGELAVLGTCNRLEVYAAVEDVAEAERRLVSELARRAGIERRALAAAATVSTDAAAVLHLCRVAAGLDSPILGEPQILGQVRRAAAGSSGPLLGRVFACAVHAGRRARGETGLGRRSESLAAVAAGAAVEALGRLAGRRALVVGAGAMGELVATHLRGCGCELVVASRTHERAVALAARVGGRAVGLDALAQELARADLLVSCTTSPRVVVRADELSSARGGSTRPLVVVDLALPRDVDPGVAALAGCRLYDLDGLHSLARPRGSRAGTNVDAAEAIAREEAARFCAWRRSRGVVATIASLRNRAEAIRVAELARMQTKLDGLSPEQRRAVETVTTQILNKLLHEPTARVKETAGERLAPALCELFALEDAA